LTRVDPRRAATGRSGARLTAARDGASRLVPQEALPVSCRTASSARLSRIATVVDSGPGAACMHTPCGHLRVWAVKCKSGALCWR